MPTAKTTVKKEPANFYEDNYIPYRKCESGSRILRNPSEIYNYLLKKVYKQDPYCQDAAMILWNHCRGITSRNYVCGPAGSGKTYVWQCLQEIYPKIIIVDASTITADGWRGENKATTFLSQVDPADPDVIVVFDEFDKLVCPRYTSGGDNVSAAIQSEFLKLIEGKALEIKVSNTSSVLIDTSRMSFVLCGSFAEKAREIARNNSKKGFGFMSETIVHEAFEDELVLEDLISFGLIPEMASRATRLINIHPLTEDDYIHLIIEHPGSPIKKLEKLYGLRITVSEEYGRRLAQNAFHAGLGVRSVTAELQRAIDAEIFLGFRENNKTPKKEVTLG
ncbi:MAG: AAA family ATPase [Eubacterium sp.]|nr:AAA family ATPase [Eubacterium sp.]